MDTNRQGFSYFFTTAGANLRCILGWYANYLTPSLFRFVRQKLNKDTPGCIRDIFGKISVFNHALNIQLFNVDSLKKRDIIVSSLMQKVLSLIGYFFICLGNEYSGFISSIRGFLFAGKRPLPYSQEPFRLPKVFRVFDTALIGVDTERVYANIYAYLPPNLRINFFRHIIAGKCYQPFTRRVSSYSYSLNLSFDRPGQEQFKPANISDIEVSTFKPPSSLFKGERIISVSTFKTREAGLSFSLFEPPKKGYKGLIKALQDILKALGANIFKFRRFSFKFRQLFHLLINRDGLFVLPVHINSLLKGKIIEASAYIKPAIAVGLGLFIYLGSIKVGSSQYIPLGIAGCFYISII